MPTAGFEALHYVRSSNLQAGDKVLVVGGGGSIGTFTIQLAKQLGAEVTAVDGPDKLALMRSLGADHVIDYTTTDYLKQNERYDLIVDVVGRKSVGRRLKLLKPDGQYYLAFARPAQLLLALWTSLTGQKKLIIQSASQIKPDLEYLAEHLAEGKLTAVIDRQFPLEEVPTAHKYSESGEKKGNIAIVVD
jgi:NADPH:quinone reductase-like Zn-dependent oxidoreductase